MKTLKLGKGLSLPLEAVTETFALLAKRRAGKSYTASVLVEQMLGAHLRTLGLVEYVGPGETRAQDFLFPDY